MFGDGAARDTATPTLDPWSKYGASNLYMGSKITPLAYLDQDLEPAPKPSVLNIDNQGAIMIVWQSPGQTNQSSLHNRMTSLNTKLAWVPQVTKGPRVA